MTQLPTVLRTLACMAVLLGCQASSGAPPSLSNSGGQGAHDGAGSGGSGTGGGGTGGGGTGGASGAGASGSGGRAGGGPMEPIDPIDMQGAALGFDALRAEAEAASALDVEGALARFPTNFGQLSYDPSAATGLDTIQASALALSEGELGKLGQQGFVVSSRREFPTFLRGFAEIYAEHLPLYVSADSILESVHSSYDTILLNIEAAILVPELGRLLEGMHGRIAQSDAAAQTKIDAELYVAVARRLLSGQTPELVNGADALLVNSIANKATDAEGIEQVELFGVTREEDFSQFTPRGHYTGEPIMQQYFRAMMWLGRVDLRLIETLPDGSSVFRPEQYAAMLLLHELLEPDMARWQTIDDAIRTFVGESDYMVVPEVAQLVEDLGGLQAAKSASSDQVVAAIVAGGYGEQQIASHLMHNAGVVETLPLNRSFLIFGQRYIADSHVFSEVVYDRITASSSKYRMMPNPLDAAFAALGNNHALALSRGELDTYEELPGALSRMRVLIDAHDESFWQANFYNLWMTALRALSPASDPTSVEGLPEVATTEAWGRRVLNAQLGSWAELRHDTLLYAKQSYTGIPECEFPDAYVDPYPEVFQAIVKYAEQGARIVEIAESAEHPQLAAKIASYFDTLREVASNLAAMAEQQRRGEVFTDEQLAFINNAVRVDRENAGCVTIDVPNGWYADLFFEREKSLEFDPTIADVHTQPADEGGAIVGKVLHVGTGYPRYFVTTIDTCSGPRAYAGVVYAYHEHVTDNFERLTDEKWSERFRDGGERPAEVPWMLDVLGQ